MRKRRVTQALLVLMSLVVCLSMSQAQGSQTALIIVDDFSGKQDVIRDLVRSELDSGLTAEQVIAMRGTFILDNINALDMAFGASGRSSPMDYCVVAGDGQGFRSVGMGNGGGDAFTLLRENGVYHGHLVEAQTYEVLPDPSIQVLRVDIPGFAIGLVANSINASVRSALETFDNVVVNLSFAMVPCNEVATIIAYEEEVVDNPGLAASNRDKIGAAISSAMRTVAPGVVRFNDYLPEVSNYPSNQNLAFVGSAGNYGMAFPLYPALFPDVVSVSAGSNATMFDAPGKLGFSNNGEVMMPGIFFYAGHEIQGTTFAAPRFSVMMSTFFVDEPSGMYTDCFSAEGYTPFRQVGNYNNRNLSTLMATNMQPCFPAANVVMGRGLLP